VLGGGGNGGCAGVLGCGFRGFMGDTLGVEEGGLRRGGVCLPAVSF